MLRRLRLAASARRVQPLRGFCPARPAPPSTYALRRPHPILHPIPHASTTLGRPLCGVRPYKDRMLVFGG
eukprot:gene27458-17125_t